MSHGFVHLAGCDWSSHGRHARGPKGALWGHFGQDPNQIIHPGKAMAGPREPAIGPDRRGKAGSWPQGAPGLGLSLLFFVLGCVSFPFPFSSFLSRWAASSGGVATSFKRCSWTRRWQINQYQVLLLPGSVCQPTTATMLTMLRPPFDSQQFALRQDASHSLPP